MSSWEEELGRVGATLLDPVAKVLLGAVDGIEGVVDAGAGLVGAVGGLFSEDFRDGVQDFIEYDITGNALEKPMDEAGLSKSYFNDTIVEDVARGVGNMLPAVGLAAVTGGVVNPAITMGVSAAGSGMEEAYADGAEYYEGLAYGAASGVMEGVTESLVGLSATKTAGLLDDVFKIGSKSVAQTGARRVIGDMVGEAAEEAISALANPALKTIYRGRDALSEYGTSEFLGDVGRSALVGGLTAGVYGATVGHLTHTSGKDADIRGSMEAVDELRREQRSEEHRAWVNGTPIDEAEQNARLEATRANLANVEKTLQGASPKTRERLIRDYGLSEIVEEDGKLRPNAAARLINEPIEAENGEHATIDRRYMSPGLWNRRTDVQAELDQINADLRQKYGFEAPEGSASIDNSDAVLYNKKYGRYPKRVKLQPRSDYYTNIMIWARSAARSIGDTRIFYDEQTNTYNKIVVDDSEDGYGIYDSIEATPRNEQAIQLLYEEVNHDRNRAEQGTHQGIYENYDRFKRVQRRYVHDGNSTQIDRTDDRAGRMDGKATAGDFDGAGNRGESTGDQQSKVKYSAKRIPDSADADAVRYNKKRNSPRYNFPFVHKNFPSESESHSEAHRLALWWAHRADTAVGDQALISMNGQWYLIEKFENSDNQYQVEERISKADYHYILKEINEHGRSGQIKSILGRSDWIDQFDQRGNSLGGEQSGADRTQAGHGGKGHQIQPLDSREAGGRERSARDGSGDRESGGTDRQRDFVKYSAKLGADRVHDVRVFDGELSEEARARYVQMKKAFSKLSEKTKTGMNFVLVAPNDYFHGSILPKGNTVYVAADTLEDGRWAGTLVHEVMHFAEGSDEYGKLVEHLIKDDSTYTRIAARLGAEIINNKEAPTNNGVSRPVGNAIQSASSNNSISQTEENVKAFEEKVFNGEDREQAADLLGELGAQMAEAVLGTEAFIERLVSEDAPLAEKIMGKIEDLLHAFSTLTDPSARAEYKRLKKAERLYLKAVKHAGYSYVRGKICTDGEEEDEERYSYEALTQKADISVVDLPTKIPLTVTGKMDHKAIIARGKQNARSQKNPNNTGTSTYVRIDDLGLDVLLGTKGMQHGLVRSEETALAMMKIGDILKNSVALNELEGSETRNTEMSYVLLGACRIGEDIFAVRSVVSKLRNNVTDIDVYQLSAVKSKKTETPDSALKRGAAVTEQSSLISSESPTISIADFLNAVKDISLFNETFSEDVARELGVDRSEGTLSSDVRYSIKYPSYSKEDIANNLEQLAKMDAVAHIDASKLEKSGKSPKTTFEEYFASLGNTIYSDVYGDIALGKSSVKSEIRHGITAAKIASIEAIPDVIEHGKVIFYENKLSGDERVKRIVIAAPIEIASEPYYMGVMLQRDPSSQYLYLHNVAIQKEMDESTRAHLVTTGADAQNEHLSMTIILQNAIDVKLNQSKNSGNVSFSLKTHAPSPQEAKPTKKAAKEAVRAEKINDPGSDIDFLSNAKEVVKMPSVSELSGKEFAADGKNSLKDRVVGFFDSIGNQVYNPDLGNIGVTQSSFRDDKAHGLTYNKVVSFAAIPEVISKGKIIDVWKPDGKPYTRITVAAPIHITGERYYMGVMIQKDHQSQRMYLHDVITEKATLSFTTEPTVQNGEGIRDKGHLFITSILQNALNVNSGNENNVGKISYSLKQTVRAEKINDLRRTAKGKDLDQTQISLGMSDNERYKRLNGRQLSLSAVADVHRLSAVQEKLGFLDQDVEFSKYGDRVRLFKKLGEEFSVFHRYQNSNISVSFSFSKENIRESVSEQRRNYINFAKMLTCLNAVIDNAVGIEVHNRNVEGDKNDNALENVYVLASAFVNGTDIIPVKLEVKEFSDKENTLHVAIALESIKQDGIVKQEVAKDGVARQDSPPSNISITDFFKKINPSDESFYKYIPKPFFEERSNDVSYSLKSHASDPEKKQIVIGMSDGERASILKEKRITPHEIKIAEGFDIDLEHLERNRKSLVEKPLIKKLRDLGALKQYRTDTVDVDFEFTAGGLRKSMNSQVSDYGGNLGDLAKVVMNMQQLLDDAVLLEIHPDKAKGTSRENHQLVQTYVLLSAYRESSSITPVQFEIKQYIDDQNRLYLAVALTKIETGVVGDTMIDKAQSSTRLIPVSAISIPQLISKINPRDENFFKYIPDTLLNRAQLASKKRAAEREAKKYGRVVEVKYSLKTHAPSPQEAKPTKKAAKEAVRAEKINDIKRTLRERDELYRRTNTVRELAQGMKDLKLGTYHNVAEFNDPRFRGSIEQLASIKIRGNLSVTKTRKVMSDLYDWYDPDSVFFKEQGSIYSQEIRDAMKAIRDGDGMLTIKELDYLEKALRHLAHIVKTYNMVYINGKYVDAKPLADGFVKNAQRAKKVTPGVLSSIMRNRYMQSNVDPAALFRFADGYRSDGFFTVMFEMLRRGAIDAEATEMELLEEWEHFFKKNKGYRKRLSSDTVLYGDKKLSLGDAISLYLTTKRKQAQAGLVYSGFAVEIDGKIQRFAPLGDPEATYTEEEREKLCAYLRDTLYSQFSKADRELISIVEKTMNGKCAEYKRETDLLRMGYTNIDGDDFYYTVIRNNVYKSIDNEGFMEAMDRVTNLSINKDIVKGARGELRILPVDRVFEHHVHQISIYRHLAIPTDTLNRLFNLNVGDNRGQPITVKTETANLPAYEYLKKLKADIEGAPSEPQYLKDLHRAVGWARAKYAIFQLGFNAKTWLTQFSSFFAAGNILRVRSIVRGMGVSAKDVDKYCTLAKLRNHENTAALAEGLLDKIGKVGEFTMKPIGGVDRLVIERLFGACQVEIEANGGAKVGTEENKIEAGKLLERVILETQQNALATERSGLMRSGDELFKSAAMFSADSMKMFGRFLDAWGEYLVLKKELKSTELSDQERADLQNRLKKAKKQVARSTASIVSQAVILAFLASAFRRFYGRKDDEDENGDGVVTWDEFFINVGQDTFGNMIGGLPFYRDIYTYFTDGFEVENFLYSTVNDVLGSVTESFSLIERTMQGKEVASDEVARTVRKAIYAGGQVLGLPTRNLYKLSTGIVSTVSPEAGYTVNSFFNTPNYSADLLNAIEAEDEKRVNTIMGLMMWESFGGLSQNAQNAVRPLLEAGHKVLPKTVGDTVTHDGEEIELTSAQKKRFREINDVSYEVVEDLVKLNQFKTANAEEQARALRYVWDTYRALAMDDLLGTDIVEKKVLFAEAIPVEKLAMIVAAAENIKADTDKNGKAIAGTRKKKVLKYIESLHLTAVEKFMVAGYLGFSNKNGLAQVKAHINTLNLSKDEKAKLLEYSGYEAA